MFKLLFVILLAYSTMVESTKIIFILAGQSNMVGEGGVNLTDHWDGIIPPECAADPRILRLNKELLWEEAREPLHQGINERNSASGVGPGMPFAHWVLQKDPNIGVIGLVPCAIVGTKLSNWTRGEGYYTDMLARARAATMNGGGEIRALLWYQGEADTGERADAESYKSRLEEFFTDVRSDLQLPSLPVVQVALASGVLSDLIQIVRKAQLETRLPNVTCVDALGLELNKGDTLHLNTHSQVQLGKMMADAFLQMV